MENTIKNSRIRKILFFVCVSLASCSFAQNGILVGVNGSIYNARSMYVRGDMTIEGQGTNTGTIQLTRHLTLSPGGSYTSTGTERFIGTVPQYIIGPIVGSNNLGYLDKQNTGNLISDGDFVCDSANFGTNGVIDLTTNSNTMFIRSGLPTALKGFNTFRTIRVGNTPGYGELARFSDRVTTYTFPLSNTPTGYRPMDIQVDTLSTPGYIYGSLVNGPPSPSPFYYSRTFASPPFTITLDCLTDNYHRFDIPSMHTFRAKAYALPCIPGSMSLVISQPVASDTWNSEVENVTGDLASNLFINTDFTDAIQPKSSAMRRGGVVDLALASGPNAVLPVELISLTANAIENEFIRVFWQTASEWSNEGFVIERSDETISWDSIGWVNGNGTTNFTHSYSFDDYDVTANVYYYYRLRQIDTNGEFQISPIVSARLNGSEIFIGNVYPNPGGAEQYVPVFLADEQLVTLNYLNVLGQELVQEKFTVKGEQNIRLNNTLATGTYLLKIVIGNDCVIKKYIKE